jgi:multidrug efflux system membrane fusion protein
MSKNTPWRKGRLTAVALVALIGAGSMYYSRGSDASPTPPEQQAVPVNVVTLQPQPVRVWSEFSGRLQAVDSAEIRPEVSGRITEIRFEDGQLVKKGEVLFVIDPRPYEAAVAKAEANLASARTNAQFAAIEQQRAAGMMQSKAIAQRLFDERANSNRMAQAAVKAADAELKQARLNLEYAHVRAPIAGRVGRAELTVGNLVQAGPGAPLLTRVVANGNIYADFEVDEQTYMQSIRTFANGRDQENKIPVTLNVKGDDGNAYEGTIYSFDNRIDATSGTIRARAKFANTDGALIPGMFVSVSLAAGKESSALLVPERALGFDQSKKFVYVVDADSKVAYREVELGKQVNSQRIVLSGVQAGERVIVEGVQHVRPDVVVAATELAPEKLSPAAGKSKKASSTQVAKR